MRSARPRRRVRRMERNGKRRGARDLRGELHGLGAELFQRHQVVAQSELVGLFALHPTTGEQHVGGGLLTDQLGQGHGQAEALMKAQTREVRAEARPRDRPRGSPAPARARSPRRSRRPEWRPRRVSRSRTGAPPPGTGDHCPAAPDPAPQRRRSLPPSPRPRAGPLRRKSGPSRPSTIARQLSSSSSARKASTRERIRFTSK